MCESVWIGLCGRSGAGKGYISLLFSERGIPAIDTDAVYREMTAPADVLSPCMRDLVSEFGEGILNPDGSLNRRFLADLVFSDTGENARKTLNRITHAHILHRTRQLAEAYADAGSPMVLIDAPLLFESGFDSLCRFTVCVSAPDEVCVARIMTRDGLTEAEARRRLASQIPREELEERCDFTVVNDGIRPLADQVEGIYNAIVRSVGVE
jgi:dephospho-CoA kinase